MLEHGLDEGAVDVGDLAPQVEHPGVAPAPPPKRPRLPAGFGFLVGDDALLARQTGQLARCGLRTAAGPLGIGLGRRQLDQLLELIERQLPGLGLRRDRRQRLQASPDLDLAPSGRGPHLVARLHELGRLLSPGGATLVQHPIQRHPPQPPPALLDHRLVAPRHEPLGRPGAQLVDHRLIGRHRAHLLRALEPVICPGTRGKWSVSLYRTYVRSVNPSDPRISGL